MAQEVVIDIKADSKQAEASLNDVVDSLKDIKKAVDGNSKAIEEQNQNTSKLAENFKKVSSAVRGFGLALKAAGIGLAIEAFNFLRDAVESNQKFANGLSKAFETLNTVVGVLLESLEPLVDIFGNIGQAIRAIVTGDFQALKNIGSDLIDNFKNLGRNIVDFGSNLGETVQQANEFADALVKMRNETKLATAEAERQLFIYQRQAEELRQIRDDESRSIEERIEANTQLGELLDRQFQTELALRQKNLELAEFELSMNKENVDLQVAAIEAQTQLEDLQERITGQRSEQLVNINALLRERAELEGTNVEKIKSNALEVEKIERKLAGVKMQSSEIQIDSNNAVGQSEIELANTTASVAAGISQLVGEQSKASKTASIAEVLFSQGAALASALRNSQSPTPDNVLTGGLAGIAKFGVIAASIATTIGRVRSIINSAPQVEGFSAPSFGGGGGSFSVGGGSGFTPLTPSIVSPTPIQDVNVVNPQSGVRAYVVESDITNSQTLTKTLNRRSRL